MSTQQFVCGTRGCDETHLMSGEEADKLSKATSDALRIAIAAELKTIIEKGVSISTLLELSRFSHTAQELLMIRSPIAEVRRKRRYNLAGPGGFSYGGSIGTYGGPGGFAMSPYQNEYGYDEGDADVDSLTNEAAQNETFGAKMTREIVSALGAMKRKSGPSVTELIDAIKQAKDAGLDGAVQKLEEALTEALGNEATEEKEPAPSKGRPRYPVPGLPVPALDVEATEPEPPETIPAPTPEPVQVMQ